VIIALIFALSTVNLHAQDSTVIVLDHAAGAFVEAYAVHGGAHTALRARTIGGIGSAADAVAAIEAGAWAVQVYTGMIYRGPHLANQIATGLSVELDRRGLSSLAELRGTGSPR